MEPFKLEATYLPKQNMTLSPSRRPKTAGLKISYHPILWPLEKELFLADSGVLNGAPGQFKYATVYPLDLSRIAIEF